MHSKTQKNALRGFATQFVQSKDRQVLLAQRLCFGAHALQLPRKGPAGAAGGAGSRRYSTSHSGLLSSSTQALLAGGGGGWAGQQMYVLLHSLAGPASKISCTV